MNSDIVVGVFTSTGEARKAFDELRRAGFTNEHLGVAGRDDEMRKEVTGDLDSKAAVGAATGAAAGAGIGLLWGLGVVANLVPAIGPVIASGTVAALAASAATGAAAAGIAGALIGAGIPDEHATYYEAEVKEGRILLTVKADGFASDAQRIIRQCGGFTKVPETATA
jgi:hypothetical protein